MLLPRGPSAVRHSRLMLRLHARLVVRPARLVALVAAAGVLSLPVLLATARLDLSFRPLFAADGDAAAATADFEARFGQPSGAHIGVLVRRERGLTPDLLAVLGRLSAELAALPAVTEVVGPGSLAEPDWSAQPVGARWRLDPLALAHSAEAAESAAAALRRPAAGLDEIVGDEGRSFLLLVRTDLPLDDLRGRTRLLRRLEGALGAALPADAERHLVGVSVVEAAYERAVLRSMARSLALTTAVVIVVLLLLYGSVRAAIVMLAGVAAAAPLSLALLALLGREITMLGSMVPTIVLVIGVADAIHMHGRWRAERAAGVRNAAAVRRMFVVMALPCLLTTVTTMAGFLSLGAARVAAIRDFGVNVAIGVALVYLANLLLLPALLRLFGDGAAADPPRRARWQLRLQAAGGRALARLAAAVVARPMLVLAVASLASAAAVAGAARLDIDQRFNEELAPHAAVRVAQAAHEREFGGFLGPELEVRRSDGGSILAPDARARVTALDSAIARVPDVHRVHAPEALLAGAPADEPALRAALAVLAADDLLGPRVRALVDPPGESVALHVRIGDVGTRRALALVADIERIAARELGDGFDARVVGQWYLAQLGMASLLHDMVASFALSLLLVLPVLGLALRSWRVFLVAIVPNLLPALAAVAFMGWTGITLRIGTALVLAVALAIGVDDSIHMLVRVREAARRGDAPARAIRTALTGTGGALVATTMVLAAGFLSMLSSDFAAIRDMGAVAAVAVTAALAADLTVLPALQLLTERRAYPRTSAQPRGYVIRRIRGGLAPADLGDGRTAAEAADLGAVTGQPQHARSRS